MWTMGAAGTVVADWAGDAGRVVEFGTRFTKPVVVPVDGQRGRSCRASSRPSTPRPAASRSTLTTTCEGEKVLGRCVAVVRLD